MAFQFGRPVPRPPMPPPIFGGAPPPPFFGGVQPPPPGMGPQPANEDRRVRHPPPRPPPPPDNVVFGRGAAVQFGSPTRPAGGGFVLAGMQPPSLPANENPAVPPPKPLVYKLLTESGAKKRRRILAPDQHSSTTVAVATSNSTSTEALIPKLEGIPKLLFVDLQSKEGDVVVSALDQLFHLLNTFDSEDEWKKKRDEAICLGAIGLLLVVMRKWLDDEDIQELSCANLAVLCFENNSKQGAMDVFSVSGGMEAVVSALEKFPESVEMQYVGVSLLVIALLFNPKPPGSVGTPTPARQALQRFIEEFDGVDWVLDAMEAFPDHKDLLCQCCDLFFRTVVADPKYRSLLWKAGALPAVATALQNHSENEDIQASGKSFMKEMFKETD